MCCYTVSILDTGKPNCFHLRHINWRKNFCTTVAPTSSLGSHLPLWHPSTATSVPTRGTQKLMGTHGLVVTAVTTSLLVLYCSLKKNTLFAKKMHRWNHEVHNGMETFLPPQYSILWASMEENLLTRLIFFKTVWLRCVPFTLMKCKINETSDCSFPISLWLKH